MSQVTVRQLAEVVGIPVERLMDQLGDAGLDIADADQGISNEEKLQLLGYLRKAHGKGDGDLDAPKRVTLKRKSHSELRVPAGTGRAKTVNVEVRKRRTYVKRTAIKEEQESDPEREAALKALEESQRRQAEEEQAREEAERKRKEAEEKERREAEERARLEAEEAERKQKEEEEARAAEKAERKAREEEEARQAAAQKQQRAAEEARAAREVDLERKRKERGRAGDVRGGEKTRYGRKQLHVAHPGRGRGRHQPRRRANIQMPDQHGFSKPTAPVQREVQVPETITVGDLAQRMAVKSGEVIKALMNMGAMVTINQSIDQDTAMLVVEEMGHLAKAERPKDAETEFLTKEQQAATEDAEEETRAPVVTVMGHVDHGKTSLLDHIRRTRVAAGEAGGITQHIGAYHVTTDKGVITFLDTPGHAAFTAMRARGAGVTDIVILVVAADDGVMPQTKEGIQHARAAGTPIIVAVNKIDKENADPDRVKNELSAEEVIPEDWGGDVQFINVSAITGEGIDDLLDAISLQAELMELKASPETRATGTVIESSLEKGRGPVATVLVQNGTLHKGDTILCGQEHGRVRAMFDEAGQPIEAAGPSMPAVVLGLSGAPHAGDDMIATSDDRKVREVAELRQGRQRDSRLAQKQAAKLENLFSQMGEGDRKTVNLMIKADVQGSVEALRDALVNLSNDEVTVNVIGAGVGGITESDANLALASNAIVIGFNVRGDAAARRVMAESELDVHYYSVIYEAIDEVKKAISGVLGTETREEIVGLAEVKDVFRSSKLGAIAGCIVVEGAVKRENPIRVLRDNVVIFEGELESLRRFKDDVKEVQSGTECGIGVKEYNDVKAGDQIECFERVEVQRTLD